jgi:hypothetical protein
MLWVMSGDDRLALRASSWVLMNPKKDILSLALNGSPLGENKV